MNYAKAKNELQEGKKVRRLSWPNYMSWILLNPLLNSFFLSSEECGVYTYEMYYMSDQDILSEDWVIVEAHEPGLF